MMNSSLRYLEATKNYYGDNNTNEFTEELTLSFLGGYLWNGIYFITCSFGLVGNGYIIWLLGFQMKRNCFTTFILNLALADFGFLTCIAIAFIYGFVNLGETILNLICVFFSHIMYMSSHFLMTAVSIDRCVAVLFPIWHCCSRPKYLSPAVCVILWTSSFLLAGLLYILKITKFIVHHGLFSLHFILTDAICLPLITLSTVVLFFKVCLKSNQKNRGQLLLMVFITLLCFLILSFPFSVIAVIHSFSNFAPDKKMQCLTLWALLLSCLNSSINPVIYFLVGRKKGADSTESIKVILENVFSEGEVTRGR